MPSKDLIVVGELNVDLILNNIAGFPKIGTEIIAEKMNLTLGSSSAIMAANAAAMGVGTAFCGMIGNDMFGEIVLKELESKKVDTQFIIKSVTHQTGITLVMNYDEDRANVTYCGAMELLSFKNIPWNDIARYKHFHLSNFFIQKGIREDIVLIFKTAKELGLSTSLDLQWDPEDKWDFDYKKCLPYVDVFMPNEAELKALTKTSNINEGIEKIKAYANTIALKMGSKGSLGIQSNNIIEVPAFKNDTYVDSIGAGDSFNSGFIKKYIEKASLKECLTNGNLMGALNTTAAGGTGAFKDEQAINDKVKSIFNVAI